MPALIGMCNGFQAREGTDWAFGGSIPIKPTPPPGSVEILFPLRGGTAIVRLPASEIVEQVFEG